MYKNSFLIKKKDDNRKIVNIALFLGFIFLLSIVLSGSVTAAGLASSPQPKFHHDNQNTGQSQYNGPKTNTLKWKFNLGNFIESSPAIGKDGTIYIGLNKLYAIKPNGLKKWTYNTGTVVSCPAIGSDGTIYIGSLNKNFYAITPNGFKKWSITTGASINSCPAIGNDGTIYIGSQDKYLYALNPSGKLKWKCLTAWGITSSPAIGSDGTIYLGSANYLYAIKSNGSIKWTFTADGSIESSPAIGKDGTIYVGCDDGKLYSVNPNGYKKWTFTTDFSIESSPAIGKYGTIYIGGEDGNLYALNPNGSRKWTFRSGDVIDCAPAIGNDGTIYFGSDKIYAINPNGSKKWTYTTRGCITTSSPAIGSDGTLYIGCYDYNLYAIQTDSKPPRVTSTNPRNLKTSASRISSIYIKFTENIKASLYWSKLTIKNLKTGKLISVRKSIIKNTLYLKTSKRNAFTWYQITIPAKAVKDYAKNNLAVKYSFRFKTGR